MARQADSDFPECQRTAYCERSGIGWFTALEYPVGGRDGEGGGKGAAVGESECSWEKPRSFLVLTCSLGSMFFLFCMSWHIEHSGPLK